MGFKKVDASSLNANFFEMIGSEYMLVSARKPDGKFNTMTASWGGVGILWNKPVAFAFIRPQRYTFEFTEQSNYFSLCFFGTGFRKMFSRAGTLSGRDINKMTELGLTPIFDKTVYFGEATVVLICRKAYAGDLEEGGFFDSDIIKSCYPKKDFHRMYIGIIEEVLAAD